MHDDLYTLLVRSLSSMTDPGCVPLQVSTETYGRAAEVEVTGDIQCLMPYIPSHLDYMLYELLKNAHRCMCVWSSCRQRKAVLCFPKPMSPGVGKGSHASIRPSAAAASSLLMHRRATPVQAPISLAAASWQTCYAPSSEAHCARTETWLLLQGSGRALSQ